MTRARLGLLLLGLAAASCAPARQQTAGDSAGVTREHCIGMFARAYVPDRSGDIFLVPEKGEFFISKKDSAFYRFMHGSPWSYDVRIPLLFHGEPFIAPGTYAKSAGLQDVAPTLLALLDVRKPKTMTGRVLDEVLEKAPKPPAVVSLFFLYGMGANRWERLESRMPNLSRLKKEGAWFSNAVLDYLPSVTSTGHATASTGTDPRRHGIQANTTYDRTLKKAIDPFANMDPKQYLVPTLSDYWDLETGGLGAIVAQGTTARAAIALAGHGGCAIPGIDETGSKIIAAMFSDSTAGWVTNEHCHRIPEYLSDNNAAKLWKDAPLVWLGHSVENGKAFLRTALFPQFQADALLEMIEGELVGHDSIPDLVLVNWKTPDYVAHQYGPESEEMSAALEALDLEIGRWRAAMEHAAGPRGSVLAITADHGMPSKHSEERDGSHFVEDLVAAIHERFDPEKRLIQNLEDSNCQIYVDHERLAELGIELADVARFVEELDYIRYAFTEDEVRSAKVPKREQRRFGIGLGFPPQTSVTR
jgi:predicted AlkP superfamily pyrophosphatase or phosphodiesterase